jgi:hypothetical protein
MERHKCCQPLPDIAAHIETARIVIAEVNHANLLSGMDSLQQALAGASHFALAGIAAARKIRHVPPLAHTLDDP